MTRPSTAIRRLLHSTRSVLRSATTWDLRWEAGEIDEAIECYKAAIGLDPQYAEAHCNMNAPRARAGSPSRWWPSRPRTGSEAARPGAHRPPNGSNVSRRPPRWRRAARFSQRPVPASRQPGTYRVSRGRGDEETLPHCGRPVRRSAFAADSKLAADPEVGTVSTICNAVMAAAGKGEDAASSMRRNARLRHQGSDRLRRHLRALDKLLASGPPASRRAIVEKISWKQTRPRLHPRRRGPGQARGGRAEGGCSVIADVEKRS